MLNDKGTPTAAVLALAVAGDVMVGVVTDAALIVSESAAVPVPPTFVALILTLNVPADVGMPVIRPELIFILRPAGSPVALKPVGVLLAVMV